MASNIPQQRKRRIRKPPRTTTNSRQFDIFRSIRTTDGKENHSNAIEEWYSIPKYFLGSKANKLRNADGSAKPYTWQYTHTDNNKNTIERTITIHPAYVEQNDGNHKAFFPGPTEELVEEALMKIYIEQRHSIHDVNRQESWILFSLSMIAKELKKRGRTRNINEIKQAIDILNTATISIKENGILRFRGTVLSELRQVNKVQYDNNQEPWCALLPSFYSRAINYLEYRQFNYSRYMLCDSQLTRWLYKRLIFRYRNASMINDYHFSYNEIKQTSGLLEIDPRKGRQKMINSLNELVSLEVIRKTYDIDITRNPGSKSIHKIVYTVQATRAFIAEQINANERLKHQREETAPPQETINITPEQQNTNRL